MSSPLRAIQDIRKHEWPFVVPMFLYFLMVITTFWFLKPLKKPYFLEFFEDSGVQLLGRTFSAEQAELIAKVCNMGVAIVAVVVFTMLSSRLKRHKLAYALTAFTIVGFAVFSQVLRTPSAGAAWSFYLFGDLYSTLMVAGFFAFLNDSVTSSAAKRLYGLIVLGGVLGGVIGSLGVRVWVEKMSAADWMPVCMAIGVLLIIAQTFAGRYVDANPPPQPVVPPEDAEKVVADKAPKETGGAFKMVLTSRYLLSIVAIVGLYEIVSTIGDFQASSAIVHHLDGEAIGRQFSTVFLIMNIVAMCVQLFFSSFIMRRFGVGAALLVLPTALLVISGGFAMVPALWVGSALIIGDGGFAYSVNQSARESLYTATSREAKYKAKAVIDMFGQRFAKAIAVGVTLLITTLQDDYRAVSLLSIGSLAVIGLWMLAAKNAGREFDERTAGDSDEVE